nr:MAG TPA: hypothetical protein [Caudoviricetes sp.]
MFILDKITIIWYTNGVVKKENVLLHHFLHIGVVYG